MVIDFPMEYLVYPVNVISTLPQPQVPSPMLASGPNHRNNKTLEGECSSPSYLSVAGRGTGEGARWLVYQSLGTWGRAASVWKLTRASVECMHYVRTSNSGGSCSEAK